MSARNGSEVSNPEASGRKVSQIAPMVASILLFFFKIKDTANQREMPLLKFTGASLQKNNT